MQGFLSALFLLFLILPSESIAARVAPLQDEISRIDLNPYVTFLEDSERTLTFEQLSRQTNRAYFKALKEPIFLASRTSSRYWLRISVSAEQLREQHNWVFYIANLPVSLYDITVWAPNKAGEYQEYHVGWGINGKSSSLDTLHYAFPFSVNENEICDIYLLVDNGTSGIAISLPLYAYQEGAFVKFDNTMRLIMTSYYSVMLSLFIYNLCLWVSTRQRVFFAYLNALFSIIVLTALIDGNLMNYLLVDKAEWRARGCFIVGLYGVGAYIEFVALSLNVKKYLPALAKVLRWNMASTFIVLALCIVFPSYTVSAFIAQLYAVIAVICIMVVIVVGIIRKIPTAPHLFAAEVCVCLGATGFVLSLQGILNFNSVSLWEAHIGYLGEALLLSFAVAVRSNLVFEEMLEAQKLATLNEQHATANLMKYKTIYNQAVQGLFQATIDGRILDANPAMAKILGYEQALELLVGQVFLDRDVFVEETDFEKFVTSMQKGEGIQDFQFKLKRRTRSDVIWVSMNASILMQDFKPIMIDGSVIDINERKEKAEAQYARQLAEAESHAKSDFLAKMSHEIRTPMTGIVGMSELLSDHLTNPTDRQYLDIIRSSGKALLTIINDILDYSKIEAGKMQLEKVIFDLEHTVFDAISVFKVNAHDRGIELILAVDPRLAKSYEGDPLRIRQILLNFLSNAVKFTHQGSVKLRVFPLESLAHVESRLRIEVIDTGIGISQDGRKNLFSSFQQASAGTYHEYGGSGLGLAIAKQLAVLMGGDVGVESTLGKGSMFWCELQLIAIEGNKLIAESEAEKLCHPIVCIVYRESEQQQVLSDLLQFAGFEVHLLGLKEFEDTAKNHSNDLLIIDEKFLDQLSSTLAETNHVIIVTDGMGTSASAFAKHHYTLELPILSTNLFSVIAKCLGRQQIENQRIDSNEAWLINTVKLAVLLVEDNSVNQLVIKKFVTKMGHDVFIANNGREALHAVTTDHDLFDIILMDCEMPIMDGYEATQLIRQWENQQHKKPCPIYALTAHIMQQQVDRCLEVGMNGHLIKPIEPMRLAEVFGTVAKSSGVSGDS